MRHYLSYSLLLGFLFVAQYTYSAPIITHNDSLKAQSYLDEIINHATSKNYNEALQFTEKAIAFCDSLNFNEYKYKILVQKGAMLREKGNFIEALSVFNKILDDFDSTHHASVLNHIGAVHRHRGNYAAALDTYYKSLRMLENAGAKTGYAKIYNNIGVVLQYQNEYDKALEYYQLALDIYKKKGDIEGIGILNLNIGEVYFKKKEYEDAINCYLEALVYEKRINDLDGIGSIYNAIAGMNIEQKRFENVTQYLVMAMDAFTQINSSLRISECEITYGNYYAALNEYNKAILHYKSALHLADESQLLEIQSTVTKKISEIYEITGNTSNALDFYKKHIAIHDSIFNKENSRKSIEAELYYKFDREQENMRIEQAKKDAISKEKSDNQKIINYFLFLIIFLLLIIVGGSFYTITKNKEKTKRLHLHQEQIQLQNEELKQKQEEIIAQRDEIERNNEILEQSRKIISEKNNRLISSIEYAQTIQKALLPKDENFSKNFKESFVIYKPKDIVSGDFYWINSQKGFIDVAVMDCTGHGVPGAFMSLIGNTLMNQIVKEWQIHNPSIILDNLDEMLQKLLEQPENKSQIHSSIDIAFLTIDLNKRLATFAGANRPLLIVKNGEFERINGALRSVGEQQKHNRDYFKNTEIVISANTNFYLTTDGYTDQMNVALKKFGQRNLFKMLKEINSQPMSKQREILINTFENYKGCEDQIDDICILGFNV